MKSPLSGVGRIARGPHRYGAVLVGMLFLLVLATAPATARVLSVTSTPAQPSVCTPVTLTVSGELSSPCYEIVGAAIQGPEPIPCMRPGPCPLLYRVEITVREPAPGTPCPTVIAPYQRSFDLGKLPAGEYGVRAVERVVPYVPDSAATSIDSSSVFASFVVRPDSTCGTGTDCYILDFASSVVTWGPGDLPLQPYCTATTAPGGVACLDLNLLNSGPVGGLQATIFMATRGDSLSPDAFIHAISVEPAGRAKGFQVGWSTDGARTKLMLFSPRGALIPAGAGPVLHLCYSVATETPPRVYFLWPGEAIVADSTGADIQPCPTFAPIAPGRLCVVSPMCDVNGDGSSNILDIIKLVRCALISGPDSSACPDSVAARADCNGDAAVDVRDVICCVRKMLGRWCPLCDRTDPLIPLPPPKDSGSADTEIGFVGPVQWLNGAEGLATIELQSGSDFAGVQFGLDATNAPVRVRDMKLIENPAGDRLEWAPDASGGARAALFSMNGGVRPSGATRLQVTLEWKSGPVPTGAQTGTSALTLTGVLSGTRAGEPALTHVVNATAQVPQAPTQAPSLLPARPNPFRESTEIALVLPSETRVSLRIFDVQGRLVRTVVEGSLIAGVHRLTWDGVDARGRAVGTGIYFARWSAGNAEGSERLLLLK